MIDLKEEKGILKLIVGMSGLAIILNLTFWGGLIYFVFWCAKHFGLI